MHDCRRPLKKITIEEEFQFSSFEASIDWDAINLRDNSPGQRSPIYYPPERESPVPPPIPPKNFGDEDLSPASNRIRQIQNRPLPSPPLRSPGCHGCNATKRTVRKSTLVVNNHQVIFGIYMWTFYKSNNS